MAISFSSLPKEIKNWLASDTATYLIIGLNKRLELKDERRKVIASLVSGLATQDLEPRNFAAELSNELDISPKDAAGLAGEIKEKILRPVERALRTELGIDIEKISLVEAAPTPEPPVSKPPVSSPVSSEEPVVIYREGVFKEVGLPSGSPTSRAIPGSPTSPKLNSIPIKPEPPQAKTLSETMPVKPDGENQKPKSSNQRVVHYGNLRTPLE